MDIISKLFGLFEMFGGRGYGEDVTQCEHALQVAHFAREDGASDTLVAAGLLHDVGQFLDGAGDAADRDGRDARHEHSGAAFLEQYFPEAVVAPIRLHVAAKRYLCAIEPAYHATLSAASALSLRLQGGPFDAGEAAAFARLPFAQDAIRLRRYDDLGKQTDFDVSPLESYRPLLGKLLL